MVQQKGSGASDLINGAVLQCLEAATLGMPLEVWKTRMGRFREESSLQALRGVYQRGGLGAFWQGTSAKMVESSSKGAILLFSKELLLDASLKAGMGPTTAGLLAGAGGGICQVTVMGPCTFLITGLVTGDKNISMGQRISRVWNAQGLKGFYPGGTALAFRQASNWASRQGLTELVRSQFLTIRHKGEANAKLSAGEEITSGLLGGLMSCWNHPFEVARIEAQARADQGQKALSMTQILSTVFKEQGAAGLFKGVVPRALLGVWQTLFMVTFAKMLKDRATAERK